MPLIVPPVPIPATKWVTRPSVCSQISGPVVCVVARRVLRVGVLVGLPGARDLPGQPVGDRVVRVGVVRRHGRGQTTHLGAVRAEHRDLVLGHLVRHHEDAPVALLLGDDRQAHAGVARRRLDDHAAGPQLPDRSAASIIRTRDPVLDRAARVEVLHLGQHLRGHARGHPAQPHERGVAHQLDERVIHTHRQTTLLRKPAGRGSGHVTLPSPAAATITSPGVRGAPAGYAARRA